MLDTVASSVSAGSTRTYLVWPAGRWTWEPSQSEDRASGAKAGTVASTLTSSETKHRRPKHRMPAEAYRASGRRRHMLGVRNHLALECQTTTDAAVREETFDTRTSTVSGCLPKRKNRASARPSAMRGGAPMLGRSSDKNQIRRCIKRAVPKNWHRHFNATRSDTKH